LVISYSHFNKLLLNTFKKCHKLVNNLFNKNAIPLQCIARETGGWVWYGITQATRRNTTHQINTL